MYSFISSCVLCCRCFDYCYYYLLKHVVLRWLAMATLVFLSCDTCDDDDDDVVTIVFHSNPSFAAHTNDPINLNVAHSCAIFILKNDASLFLFSSQFFDPRQRMAQKRELTYLIALSRRCKCLSATMTAVAAIASTVIVSKVNNNRISNKRRDCTRVIFIEWAVFRVNKMSSCVHLSPRQALPFAIHTHTYVHASIIPSREYRSVMSV